MKASDAQGVAMLIAVVAGIWLIDKVIGGISAGASAVTQAVKDGVQATSDALNPIKDTNLAYKTVNSVGAVISGDNNFALGSWVYDVTHPTEKALGDFVANPDSQPLQGSVAVNTMKQAPKLNVIDNMGTLTSGAYRDLIH